MITDIYKPDSKNVAPALADFDSLEKKVELLLEQQEAIQRTIALLKADLKEIVGEAVKSAINKHSAQGYSRIASGGAGGIK